MFLFESEMLVLVPAGHAEVLQTQIQRHPHHFCDPFHCTETPKTDLFGMTAIN